MSSHALLLYSDNAFGHLHPFRDSWHVAINIIDIPHNDLQAAVFGGMTCILHIFFQVIPIRSCSFSGKFNIVELSSLAFAPEYLPPVPS